MNANSFCVGRKPKERLDKLHCANAGADHYRHPPGTGTLLKSGTEFGGTPLPSDLDCGTRASAKLQHASTVTPSPDDTLEFVDELCLGERLCELWHRLGLRFHFSKAGRDNDRKFRPLPFYRIG